MKNILKYTMMLVLPLAFAACTEEMDEMMQPTSELQFVVGDFPAYDATTRAIGTSDKGKTEWTNGDQLIVTIGGNNMADQSLTLTLSIGGDNSHEWTPDKTIKYDKKVTPELTVTAIYAPCYEVDADGNKVLKEGMQLGMTEYLEATCSESDGKVTISFGGVTRDYSRLRIAGIVNATYTVNTEDFTPAGATTEATEDYTLTTDEIGNAYLYGTWTNGSVTVVNTELGTDITKSSINTTTQQSYVLDARPAYTYDETTKTYTVYSAEGLYAWLEAVQNDLTLNLTLMADITLPNTDLATGEEITVENGVPSGSNWTPISTAFDKAYTGTFEGNDHTITGLRINTETDYAGFIGCLGDGKGAGEIKNLTLADAVLYSTANHIGGFAGYNYSGTISGCTFGSTIDGSRVGSSRLVGGILAYNYSGIVSNCTNNGTVSASGTAAWAGGIVASCSAGSVSGCTNNGTVSSTGIDSSSSINAGGIVGQTRNTSTISGCINNGDVSATGGAYTYAGGIVGINEDSTVSGCTNNGDASATDGSSQNYMSGIVGENLRGTVSDDNVNNGIPADE